MSPDAHMVGEKLTAASDRFETHGRWPFVAVGALLPVTVTAARWAPLRPLAALLWHETEEWVWPGSFLPWINREVLGSDDDEFPIDRPVAFGINVVFGWGFSLAAATGPRGAAPATVLYVSHLANGGLHLAWAWRNRRYDPGAVTSVVTLMPAAVAGLVGLIRDPDVPASRIRAGVLGGAAIAVGLGPALKLRLRRRQRARA